MKNLLVELQLSNYTRDGLFDLACDSGFQMCIGRIRELLKIDQELHVDIVGPHRFLNEDDTQLVLPAEKVYDDLPWNDRVCWIDTYVPPNALMTRYHFDYGEFDWSVKFSDRKYDAVYLNDPMRLRHWRAYFEVYGKYQPKYFVHSHFIDNPESPKFPTNASLWWGQMEAAARADWNFWQCGTAMEQFFQSAAKFLQPDIVEQIRAKSEPWDDGYSTSEINSDIDVSQIRFDTALFEEKTKGKIVVFVPNRIGGGGRSSDYTNCGAFLFDILPKMNQRDDIVVIAGNPNQKWSNEELRERCEKFGYLKLHDTSFNRHEYKWLARRSHIAVGLYNVDLYGGTSARELIDLGCIPLWLDYGEYSRIAREAKYPFIGKSDMSDLHHMFHRTIEHCKFYGRASTWVDVLRQIILRDCSYESSTKRAYNRMLEIVEQA